MRWHFPPQFFFEKSFSVLARKDEGVIAFEVPQRFCRPCDERAAIAQAQRGPRIHLSCAAGVHSFGQAFTDVSSFIHRSAFAVKTNVRPIIVREHAEKFECISLYARGSTRWAFAPPPIVSTNARSAFVSATVAASCTLFQKRRISLSSVRACVASVPCPGAGTNVPL